MQRVVAEEKKWLERKNTKGSRVIKVCTHSKDLFSSIRTITCLTFPFSIFTHAGSSIANAPLQHASNTEAQRRRSNMGCVAVFGSS
jgi:hypothetical protein